MCRDLNVGPEHSQAGGAVDYHWSDRGQLSLT
jgi:hypothetical protein